MAVTVITNLVQDQPEDGDLYPKAGYFFVKDGHLHVVFHQANQEPHAVYAPGTWVFAFEGEKVVRKTGAQEFMKETDA